jgi:hypothetical protein
MQVTLYVQVVPERTDWHDNVYRAKTVKVTRRRPKPEAMLPDAQLVKVVLDVPPERFMLAAVEVQAGDVRPIRAVS